ncbi:MAG: hypothetical protein ABIN01_21550 [Ferruginibacter sp.]
MKKQFILLIVLLAAFCMQHLPAQNLAAKVDSGNISGADYKIVFPANWKGKLVMYAHGYEVKGLVPKNSKSPGFINALIPFLERGFAVAASDYSTQGYAVVQGVDETEALRKYFVKNYGKPDTTFMVGHSMGGAIAIATMENFGKNYKGGLPLCPMDGPLYPFASNSFDFYATCNAMFPGIEPPLSKIFAPNRMDSVKPMTPGSMFSRLNEIKKRIIGKDSAVALAYCKRLDLKLDDLPFKIFFSELVLRDYAEKAKGNPFDNTNTIYSGFPDNREINKKVERLTATVDPIDFFKTYDRTGNINQPIVLMHTLYDQLISPSVVVDFENIVKAQRKLQNLTIHYTNGQGHCAFTPQQTAQAFDELRAWANTGKKPNAGPIE